MKYILFAITATLASAATAAAGWKEESKDPGYHKKGKEKEWSHEENIVIGELPFLSLNGVQVESLPPVVVVETVSATRTEPIFPTEGVSLPHDPWSDKKVYYGKEWTEEKKGGWDKGKEVSSWDDEKKGYKKWDDEKYDGEWEGKKKGGKKWDDDEEDEWDGKKKKKKGGKKWDDDDDDDDKDDKKDYKKKKGG